MWKSLKKFLIWLTYPWLFRSIMAFAGSYCIWQGTVFGVISWVRGDPTFDTWWENACFILFAFAVGLFFIFFTFNTYEDMKKCFEVQDDPEEEHEFLNRLDEENIDDPE